MLEKLWLIQVWLLLGLSRLIVLFIPFRYLAPHLGIRTGVSPWVPLVDSTLESRAWSIGRAIRLAARLTPWKSNCLSQAITARVLLGLAGIPYCLFFGVAHSSKLSAHAWVATGRIPVTGGSSFDEFTVVGCFAAPALMPMR